MMSLDCAGPWLARLVSERVMGEEQLVLVLVTP